MLYGLNITFLIFLFLVFYCHLALLFALGHLWQGNIAAMLAFSTVAMKIINIDSKSRVCCFVEKFLKVPPRDFLNNPLHFLSKQTMSETKNSHAFQAVNLGMLTLGRERDLCHAHFRVVNWVKTKFSLPLTVPDKARGYLLVSSQIKVLTTNTKWAVG